MRKINLTGQRKGRLVVVSEQGTAVVSGKERATWLCKCDCGGERVMSSAALLKADDLCCGCTRRAQGQPITLDWLFFRCSPVPFSGCWIWMGATSVGYGHIRDKGRLYTAHDLSFTLAGGVIPDGYEVDHLCRVRCCINPDHLEAVTHSVNVLRGAKSALKTPKMHCPHGHPYTEDNRYESNGLIFCRTCNLQHGARGRAQKRLAKIQIQQGIAL